MKKYEQGESSTVVKCCTVGMVAMIVPPSLYTGSSTVHPA